MIQYFFVVFFIVDQIRPIRIKNSSKNIFKENLPVHCTYLSDLQGCEGNGGGTEHWQERASHFTDLLC